MAYDTAGAIISDAAAELGLGTVSDAYGSTDANVIQLRSLLKSAGRDILRDRDWSSLLKEYSFVTLPNWVASTAYTANAPPFVPGDGPYVIGKLVQNNGNLYRVAAGSSGSGSGIGPGPQTQTQGIADGTVKWNFQSVGSASIVVKGLYSYTCKVSGTSGTAGPYGSVIGATEVEGTVTWQCTGRASDYALPSDFSNMVDQTGWNRTNRLPLGGPINSQMWQYLKGRTQGIVFNVAFRFADNILRLYPDTDPPGGYNVVLEYVSSWWVSPTGGTVPTTDAPTANSDVIYFDQLMMMRRLKVDWLKAKGFDTTNAQQQLDEAEEQAMNTDGTAETLRLGGPGDFDPLVGPANIPFTGIGS